MGIINLIEPCGSFSPLVTVTGSNPWRCRHIQTLLPSCYTDTAGFLVTDRALNLGQIEKLVSSQTLHGSESLCKLLRYLAKHVLDHPGIPLKEYQIAT
jgi:hypothetical protein